MTILGRISHILNVVFRLPHPGPDAIQGPCGCREHEGSPKYTFRDYLRSLIG